jgi:hypothetical protein
MFDDLDETIRQLLIAEMPVRNGEIELSFDQPKRQWSGRLSKPTLNLFLYDVRENAVLRQHQWERLPGNGSDSPAHLKRTPLRVDCTYMLTAWATVPEDEHRLLTRALLALFRFPILPEERLVGALRKPPFDIQTRLASHDKLTNPAEVWSSLDNEMRPSISYVVTLALDPWEERMEPVVITRRLQTGQALELPDSLHISEDSRQEMGLIGGKVIARDGQPMALDKIEVAIKGTGLFTKTDDQGRFRLGVGSLPSGRYILVVSQPKGKPTEKKIHIPEKEGNYDIEI